MSWTEARVERLSVMWLAGQSASQIAAELGEGVSRNAVIGKVHRLGLSGRTLPVAADGASPRIRDAAPAEPSREAAAAPEPAAAAAEPAAPPSPATPAATLAATLAASPPSAAVVAPHGIDGVAAVIDAAPEPITFDLPALRAAKESALPVSDRVTILELSGSMCRWPIGDPTNAEFRFCGCRAAGTLPYCQDHARVAFQPVADRRRTERMIRIA
ncbi:GcrA family cell cycle regulator [Lichenibacterium ramalinae]|uniref:GcrA cell cycle regulator n=1 Tax=Lichenibacterium ramalinae TaxID=2316527 RepID=A0A4Q2R5I8_9HYPH|nr:GcrA family cell cycle regulator [Lichenibacterium ramalinae]RYB01805.1 GcrA cell cycle regulator [Lichenibacterium ramalinae]